MKRILSMTLALALALICLTAAQPSPAALMGSSGGHDLDRLWNRAQQRYDLAHTDAVLLLESRHISILDSGGIKTLVHRVVWIGTVRGIRDYADLRIPYNSTASSLTVTALRTWREDRWWPDAAAVSPTAVVETLPYAVALADDYTSMRETMLLHDGVEIPCIMETAYEIEERGMGMSGRDDVWIFPQRDPAILSILTITAPSGVRVAQHVAHGAPEAELTENSGSTTYTWRMEEVEPLGTPLIASPVAYAPHVSWSTWCDWKSAGDALVSRFDEAAVIGNVIVDSLAVRLRHEPSTAAKARAVVSLVNEWTRRVDCDFRFWLFSPRPAARTWETAYGHDLDRAALAAGLLRSAGLNAELQLYSAELRDLDLLSPGPAAFEKIGVWIESGDFHALYDPHTGTLIEESPSMRARTVWRPAEHASTPYQAQLFAAEAASRFELLLTLEPDAAGGYSGRGFLNADHALCPYGDMVGLESQALSHIQGVVRSVLPDGTVNEFNPEIFQPYRISAGFNVSVKKGTPDDRDRTALSIGDPRGGIVSRLPADIHPHQEIRTSPVSIPAAMTQRIQLRLKVNDSTIVQMPAPRMRENSAGRFEVKVSREDGWITIERLLTLEDGTHAADTWPDLRSLLLEESDAANRTIVVK
jgi:hypothetical protein